MGAVLLQTQLLEARVHDAHGRTSAAVAALNRFKVSAAQKILVKDAASGRPWTGTPPT